ncbi:unnamed protein product, partial [Heterotrigona itama]
NNFYHTDEFKKKATNYCIQFGHSLWSVNQLSVQKPRLNSGSSPGSGGDGQAQIVGAGVIGPASAEKNCKSVHLTAKQQAICSRSPPVLQ